MNSQAGLLKRLCGFMAMVLVALLAVGPFLHAHFGASSVTGLHVAGIQAIAMADPTQTEWSPHDEGESAAVGVETSYARQISMDVEDPPHGFVLWALYILAAWPLAIASKPLQPFIQRTGRTCFQPGFPLLMHAPPL